LVLVHIVHIVHTGHAIVFAPLRLGRGLARSHPTSTEHRTPTTAPPAARARRVDFVHAVA